MKLTKLGTLALCKLALSTACIPLDPNEQERQNAARYSRESPFQLGADPTDAGPADPNGRYLAYAEFGGLLLTAGGQQSFVVDAGFVVQEPTDPRVVLLAKEPGPSNELLASVRGGSVNNQTSAAQRSKSGPRSTLFRNFEV
jgi:hypothetical protein